MSCPDCQQAVLDFEPRTYIRVGLADVCVLACVKHAALLIETYRRGISR